MKEKEKLEQTAFPLTLSDPKVAAAALAFGGRLESAEPERGRLCFIISGVPSDFLMRVMNDEVRVSARAFISATERVLGLIEDCKRRGLLG
jgi:hypothetical protein